MTAERETGISGAQLFALQAVAKSEPVSITELATLTLTHQSSVSVVARKLVEQGLILRRVSPSDGRRVELALSARGRALLGRSPAAAQDRLIAAIQELPAPDRRNLARLLTGLGARLDQEDAPAPPMFFEGETELATRRTRRRA